MPVRSKPSGNIGYRPTLSADLRGRPPPRSVGHRQPRARDPRTLVSPRSLPTPLLRAAQAMLVPSQDHWKPEARQIDQLDHRPVLDPGSFTTLSTPRPDHDRLDGDLEPTGDRLDHLDNVHIGQSYQQLARVALNTAGAPPDPTGLRHRQIHRAPATPCDPHTPLRREAPDWGQEVNGSKPPSRQLLARSDAVKSLPLDMRRGPTLQSANHKRAATAQAHSQQLPPCRPRVW